MSAATMIAQHFTTVMIVTAVLVDRLRTVMMMIFVMPAVVNANKIPSDNFHATNSPGQPICYNCRRPGHYRPSCPDVMPTSKQAPPSLDVIFKFAALNPCLLEEFIAQKKERDTKEARDK
jgi:hypothetical protein